MPKTGGNSESNNTFRGDREQKFRFQFKKQKENRNRTMKGGIVMELAY